MLVAVTSLKGSPGVTTFVLALAARWPLSGRPLVVEADPAGGDVGARFSLDSSPGLLSFAAASRRNADPDVLWKHTQELPGGLRAVIAPPSPEQASAALAVLLADSEIVPRLSRTAGNDALIVDCGRMDPGSPSLQFVKTADAMVLLTRPRADDLAHLAARLDVVGPWSRRPALVLVGDGYSAADVSAELGVPVLGHVPHDAAGAAVLGGRPARGWRSSPSGSALGRATHQIAKRLMVPAPTRTPAPTPALELELVPGVPGRPVSVNGVRLAPQPSEGAPS